MKCIHCGSEWNVSPGLSVSITNCPFCGKSLLPEKKQLNTVEDVLVEINRLFGVSVLADETKLVAYFSDLAPQLSRQRRILSYFVECGGPKKIVAVLNSSDDERSVCIKQIVREMKDEMYIEEAASQMICESFLFAVSGRRVNEISTVSAPKVPLSPANLATVSQGRKDEMSAEEQYQKGEAYFNGVKSGNSTSKDYSKAFAWYQKAALRGHPLAQCQLGLLYREGHGVPKDEKQAFDWFMKAAHANQNCPRGKFYVGRSYHHGNGVQKDYKEAVRWYTMAAQQNDAYAQLNLGSCYEWGEGVSTDYQKAAYWYELSANQGEPLAKCNLGLLYKRGKGVQKDLSKAVSLFRESANQGEAYGILQLGICYLEGTGIAKDTVQAFSLLKKAAVLGEDVAQFKLAEGFENGTWESEDPAQAFNWYKKAADQGLSSAQVKVGRCYAEGYGVAQNYSEAVYWYQKAADKGNGMAMTLLGSCYEKGQGVAAFEYQAVAWYEKAIKAGDPLGLVALLLLYMQKKSMNESDCKKLKALVDSLDAKLKPVLAKHGYYAACAMVDYSSTTSTGVEIMRLCAEDGRVDAQLWLGQAFDAGVHVPMDKQVACYWYKKAADQGSENAVAFLKDLNRKELTEARVNALVKKHHLESKYFVKGTAEFNKKIMNAVSAYAVSALTENPLLLYDNTVFGSAKEGFVLTSKTLFYNGGFLVGKAQHSIAKIESVSTYVGQVNRIDLKVSAPASSGTSNLISISYTADKNEAARIEAFWKDLLQLN